MRPDDRIRLQHVADALEAAIGFAQGRTRSDLDTNRMLLFALIHAIQIVGEAASKISIELRSEYADMPWVEIIGMRHKLVHAYYDVNHDILWATVTKSAPELLATVQRVLASD